MHSLIQRCLVPLFLATLAATGCEAQDPDALGPLCLEDCELCNDETGCVPDRCGILIIMSGDCEGKVPTAEVAVDQCLEDQEVAPGSAIVTCATLKEGDERRVIVRSKDWLWQETVACTSQNVGSLVPVALYCIAN